MEDISITTDGDERDSITQTILLPDEDDDAATSSSSSSNQSVSLSASALSVPSLRKVDSDLQDTTDTDTFSTMMSTERHKFTAPSLGGLKKKSFQQHESFRGLKGKKEQRHQSFVYKQVSDEANPTAHRKQLFSKRSTCK
jgi:hypothetical protein